MLSKGVALRDIPIDKHTLAPPKYLLPSSSSASSVQQPTPEKPAASNIPLQQHSAGAVPSAGNLEVRRRHSCSLMRDRAACLAFTNQVSL